MPRHAGGYIAVTPHGAGHCARCGVIHNRAVIQQAILTFFGAFSGIVRQACQFPVWPRSKCRRKFAAQFSRADQVLGNRLIFLIAISTFPNMGIVRHITHNISSLAVF